MIRPMRLAQWTKSARVWVLLGVLAPIGMLAASGAMLLELRRHAWAEAAQTSQNLLQVVERDIARNIEIIDLALSAAIDSLKNPSLMASEPSLRQLMLFDRATAAKDIGVMLVLDENGDSVYDAAGFPPRKLNNADRDYFQAHKASAKLGLAISRPLVSRLTGVPIVVLSRRIDKADGSFGGIALVSLKLSYFTGLFDHIGLGRDSAINLYHLDGTRLMRHPFLDADIGANIAGTSNFERFVHDGEGSFVGTSVRDGVERHYAFKRVGNFPLILNVALSTSSIDGEWRAKALVISAASIALCALAIALSLLFGRELGRRETIQRELAALSRTDALTGLANRRSFDEALARDIGDARRRRLPLGLLVVDVDHFKRCNDLHGHAVGDEALRALARALAASVRRPGDTVARLGGEEFALLLPEADEAGCARIAEAIHRKVADLAIGPIERGGMTVSVGVAAFSGSGSVDPHEIYRLADRALYEAKASGRNRTCRASLVAADETRSPAAPLRLVSPA